MKIGYLGGIKDGETSNVLVGFDKTKLEWEVEREKPTQNVVRSGGTIIYNNRTEYDVYKLLILTREGEQKFFYVLDSLQKNEIESLSSDHWDKSDILGYIF
ncbi:hypothetical protein [Acinetobacter radioresistens]|uniref:hypothetical protein n=1 Tax=Acinetobacter radioresistens TaxID=40216 RepID=UPI0022452DF2|nr:hypothetical protein [Acinetobacter radioresistens]MCX0334790.1 hypothetical protein [Acinetobacter radioresistens]